MRLRALPPEREQESDEVYLLSRLAEPSVKVRGGQMDMKRLERVDHGGLEQWRPVMKASFPLSADDIREVWSALGSPAPPLARPAYSLEELRRELVDASPDLIAVEVHKERRHFTVAGAMVELSELATAEGARPTIAVESEDPALVHAALTKLGLGGRANVSVPRGLKAILGFGAHRFAVLDVGTNSVKFHVAERGADGAWTTVVDRAAVTRLGEGLADTGELAPAPMERTVEAIREMVAESHELGAEAIAAVATAGVRMASNGPDFVLAVRAATGVEVEVISGDDEARLAYVAATSALPVAEGLLAVFDTGGGSSQFTFGTPDRPGESFSVNVGAARLTEQLRLDGIVDDATLAAARIAIAAELSALDGRPPPDAVIGLGGANTNLAAVSHELAVYDPEVVQGTILTRQEVDRQIELYRSLPADERRTIVGLQPDRAPVILAGALIVRTVLGQLGALSLTVSDRGLRHGLLAERFGG